VGKVAVNEMKPAQFEAEKQADRSRRSLAGWDKTTVAGRARRSKLSSDMNRNQGGRGLLGIVSHQDSAAMLFSLLEARVKESHRDTLHGFVAELWLEEIKSADQATKNSLCMLSKTAFTACAPMITPTKKKLPKTRDPLEQTRRQKDKAQAIYDLIISTPAAGDNSKNPKTTDLGRILSHIIWRRATIQNNARPTHSDED